MAKMFLSFDTNIKPLNDGTSPIMVDYIEITNGIGEMSLSGGYVTTYRLDDDGTFVAETDGVEALMDEIDDAIDLTDIPDINTKLLASEVTRIGIYSEVNSDIMIDNIQMSIILDDGKEIHIPNGRVETICEYAASARKEREECQR